MKFVIRISTLILAILMLATLFTCVVSAQQDWYASNLDAAEPLLQGIEAQDGWYINKKDLGWSETAFRQITDILGDFESQINRLKRVHDRSTEAEMKLVYEKGTANCLLTWIYYVDEDLHRYTAVTNKYNELTLEITSAADLSFFTSPDTDSVRTVEDCYKDMLVALYGQKIRGIEALTPEDPDSDAVKGIIHNAAELELKKLNFRADFYCYYDESDSENYENYRGKTNRYQALYEETLNKVNIQRNREAATAQMSAVFAKLYPNDSFAATTNPKIAAFKTALKQKTTVAEMNDLLKDTIGLLLKDLADAGNEEGDRYKAYREEYLLGSAGKDGVEDSVVKTADAATESGIIASLAPLFDDFNQKLEKADAKDELVKYATESIKAENPTYSEDKLQKIDVLVGDYNAAESGILDRADANNVDLELERAKRRLDLLVEYYAAIAEADRFLGSSAADVADFDRLSDELTSEYDAADAAISSSGVAQTPAELLNKAKATFADTVAEAEACAFENAHATILGVTPEQIAAADKATLEQYRELLDAAIADAAGTAEDPTPLSPAAIAKLESRTDDAQKPTPILTWLGTLYKEVAKAQIAKALEGNEGESETITDTRTDAITKQQEEVDKLPSNVTPTGGLENLTELPKATEDLITEAEDVDSLLDHYHENVDDTVKNTEMESFCGDAADKILDGSTTADDAITELNRMEAEEKIEQAAKDHVDVEGVQDILDKVAEDLDKLTTEEEIDDYVDDTIFQIDNCVKAEDLREEIQETIDRIKDMDFLDDEKKDSYLDKAEDLKDHLPTIENAADKDTDEEKVKDAVEEFEKDRTELENTLDVTEDAHDQYQSTVDAIDKNEHITDDQKDQWKSEAEDSYNDFLDQVTTGQTDPNTAQSTLNQNLLALEQAAAKAELTEIAAGLIDEIGRFRYLDADKKAAYIAALGTKRDEILATIDASTSAAEVAALRESGPAAIREEARLALKDEQETCCHVLSERLDNAYTPSDYSTDAQQKLAQTVLDYEKKLSTERSVAENEATFAEAMAIIEGTDNLLQEAQKRAEAKLTEEYNFLISRSDFYSAENLAKLTSSYEASLAAIRADRPIAEWQQVDVLALDAVNALRAIRLDRLYTEDKLLTDDTLTIAPDDYDPTEDGYAGEVVSPNGIPFDAVLTVTEGRNEGIEKLLKKAAKAKKIFPADGSAASKDLLRRLKDTRLCAALDITVATSQMYVADRYTVSILLPESLRDTSILGIVCFREDGSAEFYEVTAEDDRITFETTHFSEYYVVRENVVNLLPWVILLCIFIVCEAIALLLLYMRKNHKSGSTEVLSSFVLPVTALTIYRPVGGVWILWILGAIALALAGWIAWLVITELRNKYPETEYPEEEPDAMPEKKEFPEEETAEAPIPEEEPEATKAAALPEPEPVAVLTETEPMEALPESEDTSTLPEPEAALALPEREAAPALPEHEAAPVLKGRKPTPALDTLPKRLLLAEAGVLPEVTVEEAEELMEDEVAREELENETETFIDIEVYEGTKKAEINIDTISEHFECDAIVTLNALKERKLVKKNVGHVKILARGTLDKPLTVIAQDFSTAALKMILLTGGTPVVTKPSPQRMRKR